MPTHQPTEEPSSRPRDCEVPLRPRFSFIVPTFMRPRYLAEALESIAAQTIVDWECVVVDDASPVPPTLPPDRRFRLVVRDENAGPAAARNSGVRVARGDVIVFLDDDDLVVPRRLEIAEAGLQKAPVALCWGSAVGNPNRIRRQNWNGDVSRTILKAITPHLGQTAVLHSEAPDFDERYLGAQDVEWWLRLAQSCEVATVPQVGWLWRKHDHQRVLNGIRARIAGRELLLQEHQGYFLGNRGALAFQLRRLGLQRGSIGEVRGAAAALLTSMKIQPSVRTATGLGRLLFKAPHRIHR